MVRENLVKALLDCTRQKPNSKGTVMQLVNFRKVEEVFGSQNVILATPNRCVRKDKVRYNILVQGKVVLIFTSQQMRLIKVLTPAAVKPPKFTMRYGKGQKGSLKLLEFISSRMKEKVA